MSRYIRIDMSTLWQPECFLIPTISISKWCKGFEINIHILLFTIYTYISYIKEDEYEP